MSELFEHIDGADDAWLENLKQEHQRTVANLKGGGPPVNHDMIDRYIAGLLEDAPLNEVIDEITTWKSWFEAEKEMRAEVYEALRDLESDGPEKNE